MVPLPSSPFPHIRMRVVSLLPAATEWIAAFGALDQLVGRSHECDYPDAVTSAPVVTRASYDGSGTSAEIDTAVQERLQQGLSLYEVDLDRLKALDPELIVTQDQCEVCAVSLTELERALRDWGGEAAPDLVSLQPSTFKEVLDGALRLGRTLGRSGAAMRTVADGEIRLQQLRAKVGVDRRVDPETLPTVACIEWMDPLMTAGHWMPDVAEHAGARSVLSEKGGRSPGIAFEALRQANPDAIGILPCGFTVDQTVADLDGLTEREGWRDLDAVRNGRVAILDGNAYFNRPGPRLVRSCELLASVVHGRDDLFETPVQRWERIWLEEAVEPSI